MLSKTYFLATLLGLSFSSHEIKAKEPAWHNVRLEALINSGVYLSSERWHIRPHGINIPTHEQLNHMNRCYQPRLEQFLKEKLIGQTAKVKFSKPYLSTQLYRQAHLKFDKKHDLSAFLLSQGWATINSHEGPIPKTYQKAEAMAKQERKGLWGECDNWYRLRERQRLKGQTLYLAPRHKTYLTPVSTGWVEAVLTPNILKLNGGQLIKLQAVSVPNQESRIQQCWHSEVTAELEKRLIGKKVRLERDQLQLTTRGRQLQRYVWLEGNRWQSPLLINEWLVKAGLAQLQDSELNLKYVEVMHKAKASFESNDLPPTWWQQCASQIIKKEEEVEPVVTPEIKFDEMCRIKGNIAGSKKNPKLTYHTPLSGWYKRIEAEACFEDEASAEAEGFIKVK